MPLIIGTKDDAPVLAEHDIQFVAFIGKGITTVERRLDSLP